MAPIKRARLDNGNGEASSAILSSELGPRKKARTSIPTVREDSDNEGTVYSALSAGSVSEGEDPHLNGEIDEDAIERIQTQLVREKYEKSVENTPAESGIIERVDCFNFMCHEHFYVELGPLINFIVGKNGSGKSAILTAITLCLGGKASATNRGQSLKNFIKEGKDSATIIVRLKNQGDGAYLAHEYGNSIIVERHFSRSGSSGFKLKSADNRIVSNKKSELDNITDYFALQIDNPMNVLSQDMARQFLSTSSAAEKYKFFIKGVQLEQLDQDYHLIEESIDNSEAKMSLTLDQMKELEKRRNKAQSRLALSERHDTIQRRIEKLRAQMAWVQVEEQERILNSCDERILKMNTRIEDLEGEVRKFEEVFQQTDRECNEAGEVLQQAKSEYEAQEEVMKASKEKVEEGTNEQHSLQAQQRTIRECLKTAEDNIKATRKKIDEENQRLADLDGGSHARRLAEVEEKKAEADQAANRYRAHQQELGRIQEDISRAEREVSSKRDPISKQRDDLAQAETQLRNLTRDKGHQQSGFPEKMPTLLRAIQNEQHRFSRPPVGPIGNHVRLLKPKWSGVLESSLGNNLSSFVVTSKRDSDTLLGIMRRVGCECTVLIGNDSGPMDTSGHEPDARFDTIDNELVRRQLVISNGIEQVLLIEDLEEASKILFDGERPRNVKRCFCIDQRDRRRGIHLSFTRAGEPNQTPVQAYTGRPRMKTDIESQIRMQQDAVNNLKQVLHDLETQQRTARTHLEKCRQALTRHKRQEDNLQIESQRAEDLVEELRDAINRDSVQDGRLDALKEALEEAEAERRTHESSYENGVIVFDDFVQKLKVIKREARDVSKELASREEKVLECERKATKASEKRSKALSEKNAMIARHETAIEDKAKLVESRQTYADNVDQFVTLASTVSARVPIDRGETASSLDKKYAKFQREADMHRQQMGASRDEIAAAAAEAEQRYEACCAQMRELERTAQRLKSSVETRRIRWGVFRANISQRAKSQFMYLLSERSFRGRLLTDHTEKLLDIQIEPDITKESAKGRKATTLSGGEKSFSQICLLLSLWEAMGSPIRCLDEFDVFMDQVNRRMSIEMLMLAARRSVGRQFIFITPGSRDDISLAPDVRVKELAEPERGQTTLSFNR
ncbi:Structural maintenance of chromosomes protein 6 [Onygenales sp. PD_40]|nr:Structural maintenance of chromosomes protein 6 [Onygenales sp. PD_40]